MEEHEIHTRYRKSGSIRVVDFFRHRTGKIAHRSTSYPFYHKGDIGNFALYNRGLTTAEIQANENGYQA
jgi:hypothetical protein